MFLNIVSFTVKTFSSCWPEWLSPPYIKSFHEVFLGVSYIWISNVLIDSVEFPYLLSTKYSCLAVLFLAAAFSWNGLDFLHNLYKAFLSINVILILF